MEKVRSITLSMRELHEQMLTASGIDATGGTCLYASHLLCESLNRFADCTARVRGGGGGDGGARDIHGALHGHYWVEGCTNGGESFVVDITADQFGFPSIYLDSVAASRDRYVPGDDAAAQEAVQDLIQEIGKQTSGKRAAK